MSRRTFLLPDLDDRTGAAPHHWMVHWRDPRFDPAVVWGDGSLVEARLADSVRRVEGSAVVVEGRRIAGFAALCERRLDLSIAAALLVVTGATAAGTLADVERWGDELWFAPFAFPAILALGDDVAGPARTVLLRAAREWGAETVSVDLATLPRPGRSWVAGPRLLAEAAALGRAPRRTTRASASARPSL